MAGLLTIEVMPPYAHEPDIILDSIVFAKLVELWDGRASIRARAREGAERKRASIFSPDPPLSARQIVKKYI
jgi:hypothetical protein